MKTKMTSEHKFENRTRFNWGYHDAAQCVKQGWDLTGDCFAARWAHFTTPAVVLREHDDSSYAAGWAMGYRDAYLGTYCGTSEPAWVEYQANGAQVPATALEDRGQDRVVVVVRDGSVLGVPNDGSEAREILAANPGSTRSNWTRTALGLYMDSLQAAN